MDKWPLRTALTGALAALALASLLVPQLKAANPQDPDVVIRVLGGTADLAAEQAYREADIYFHAGLKCECPDKVHHTHHEDAEPRPSVNLPLLGLVKRLHGESAPRVHRHLEGEEEKEILPWFVIATRLNPHHIEAWRTGSYWFYRTGDPDRAEEFINEGIRRNPKDYRLYLDRGILHHRLGSWERAIRDLETARRLWKNDSEDAPYDLHAIRTYLGDSRKRVQQPTAGK